MDSHNIAYDNNIVLVVNNIINDFKEFNSAKEERIDLIEKKDKFIKDNNLEGFVSENVKFEKEKNK